MDKSCLFGFRRSVLILFTFLTLNVIFTNSVFAVVSDTSSVVEQPAVVAEAPASSGGDIDAGADLFKKNCKACHALDEKKVGPALRGVTARQNREWIINWIHNPQKVIDGGDAYAEALYKEYGSMMTSFPALSEGDIDNLLTYIEEYKEEVVPTPGLDPNVPEVNSAGDNTTLVIALSVILVVLVLIVIVLILMSVFLTKHLSSKENLDEADLEIINQKHSIVKVLTHPAFIGGVVLIALLVGAYLGVVKGLYNVGVQQGYRPVQPIAFSHKIHAGDHEIDCNYCHTGVRKAKHANIPSANICMNCHIEIKLGSPKLAKLYEAVGFDPDKKGEWDPNTEVKPIEWVRVHNLPDLAYFNHAQHAGVAGLECEECHGPIKEMDEQGVYQYSPLTMGWCIDCHRNKIALEVSAVKDSTDPIGRPIKEVKNGNEYYNRLMEVHEVGDQLTVEEIGGLECSKCHY